MSIDSPIPQVQQHVQLKQAIQTPISFQAVTGTVVDPIVQLNNLGCSYLQQGEYDRAIRTLSNTLCALRAYMKEQKGSCPRHDRQDLLLDEEERYSMFCERTSFNTPTEKVRSPLEERFGYIYKRPIELKDVSLWDCQMTKSHDSLVVMFNLALAYQLLSCEMIEQRSYYEYAGFTYHAYLKQALSLYELSNAVMECENVESGPVFVMAITNNVGQCQSLLGNYEKAQQCFEHLLSIQVYLIDRNSLLCDADSSDTIQDDDLIQDEFVYNTSQFVVLNNCSAQAA